MLGNETRVRVISAGEDNQDSKPKARKKKTMKVKQENEQTTNTGTRQPGLTYVHVNIFYLLICVYGHKFTNFFCAQK